ncbi:hypothetical protein OKA04_04215 [Luteolibacter flavescens]|uniref:Uncharacterized protein n=1 Tax=Luteolibacter flavescens TaxID=1859460 RepID=A0ABT3FKQ4_9BACT|nr:hypothetical protein [Luteolibacter flavescens]MCW1883919.1 hypothetical protein [Luteolibacter flavescens]
MNPSATRTNEQRWFWRTVGCTAGLCLGMVTWAISSYLTQAFIQEIIMSSDLPDPDYMREKATPIRVLTWTTGGLFLTFGPGLLFCFTKWLLAIRRRRAIEAAYFGVPPAR